MCRIIENRTFSILLIFIISFCVYIPSLCSEFVWDDVITIERSSFAFSSSGIKDILIPPVQGDKSALYYRPVIYASMVLDKALWGVSPFGFHLTNAFINSLTSVFFYIFAIMTLTAFRRENAAPAAFLSALLFSLFPMHTESVSWVSGRTDIFCGMFLLLGLIFHTMSAERKLYALPAGLMFFLSLLSKESAAVFPVLVLAFDLLSRRIGRGGNLTRYILYISVLGLYIYLKSRAFVVIPDVPGPDSPGQAPAAEPAIRTADYLGDLKLIAAAYLFYLKKLAFPFYFNSYIASVPAGALNVIISSLVLAVLAAVAIASRLKKEYLGAFSILWVIVALIPAAAVALMKIASTPLAERYLYIPSIGYCLLLGYGILSLSRRRNQALFLALICVALFAFFTFTRQQVWNDRVSLWRDASVKSPESPVTHINYGMALLDSGRYEHALNELQLGYNLGSRGDGTLKALAANNIGVLYIDSEDLANARLWFEKAYNADHGYYKTYYHMGLVNYLGWLLDDSAYSLNHAKVCVQKSIKIKSDYAMGYLMLSKIYDAIGNAVFACQSAGLALEYGLNDSLASHARDIIEKN